jgi:caffeoyl-CoA O-methyltransferase
MERFINEAVEGYAKRYTTPEPELLQDLEKTTWAECEMPQMISGRLSGRFLKMLTLLTNARSVIEVGTFTGYSALSIAEGLPQDGRLITCDVDPKTAKLAQTYFDRSPHGKKITLKLGPALETIKSLDGSFDLAFIDADKDNYPFYYEAILNKLRPGGVIAIDNCLWSGKVLTPTDPSTLAIARVNELIARDERVENVILTVRDGINLVRKK